MNRYREVSFLIVDDDETDVEAFVRGCKRRRMVNPIHAAKDGQQALDMLRSQSELRISRPLVILLDLNMPIMGGLEFLKELRNDPEHRDHVVFVLTSSEYEKDIVEAYKYNIAGYIPKSHAGDGFESLMEFIEGYSTMVVLRKS